MADAGKLLRYIAAECYRSDTAALRNRPIGPEKAKCRHKARNTRNGRVDFRIQIFIDADWEEERWRKGPSAFPEPGKCYAVLRGQPWRRGIKEIAIFFLTARDALLYSICPFGCGLCGLHCNFARGEVL